MELIILYSTSSIVYDALFCDVSFISYANNCYAVYPVIRAVMQGDSCNEFMQNTVMRHADYRHPNLFNAKFLFLKSFAIVGVARLLNQIKISPDYMLQATVICNKTKI